MKTFRSFIKEAITEAGSGLQGLHSAFHNEIIKLGFEPTHKWAQNSVQAYEHSGRGVTTDRVRKLLVKHGFTGDDDHDPLHDLYTNHITGARCELGWVDGDFSRPNAKIDRLDVQLPEELQEAGGGLKSLHTELENDLKAAGYDHSLTHNGVSYTQHIYDNDQNPHKGLWPHEMEDLFTKHGFDFDFDDINDPEDKGSYRNHVTNGHAYWTTFHGSEGTKVQQVRVSYRHHINEEKGAGTEGLQYALEGDLKELGLHHNRTSDVLGKQFRVDAVKHGLDIHPDTIERVLKKHGYQYYFDDNLSTIHHNCFRNPVMDQIGIIHHNDYGRTHSLTFLPGSAATPILEAGAGIAGMHKALHDELMADDHHFQVDIHGWHYYQPNSEISNGYKYVEHLRNVLTNHGFVGKGGRYNNPVTGAKADLDWSQGVAIQYPDHEIYEDKGSGVRGLHDNVHNMLISKGFTKIDASSWDEYSHPTGYDETHFHSLLTKEHGYEQDVGVRDAGWYENPITKSILCFPRFKPNARSASKVKMVMLKSKDHLSESGDGVDPIKALRDDLHNHLMNQGFYHYQDNFDKCHHMYEPREDMSAEDLNKLLADHGYVYNAHDHDNISKNFYLKNPITHSTAIVSSKAIKTPEGWATTVDIDHHENEHFYNQATS